MGFYICMASMIKRNPGHGKCTRYRKRFCATVVALFSRQPCIRGSVIPAEWTPKTRTPMSAIADSLFELTASYVSVSSMSREPRREVGCRAQSKETEATTRVLDETGSVTTAEPTTETHSGEDIDLPWQGVGQNESLNLIRHGTLV